MSSGGGRGRACPCVEAQPCPGSPRDMPLVRSKDWAYTHYVQWWWSGVGMSLCGSSALDVDPFRSTQLESRGACGHGCKPLTGVGDCVCIIGQRHAQDRL